jgi:PEP-CTERM motif
MPKRYLARVVRAAMVAALTVAFADRASADSILLSDVQIQLDLDNMIASITGGLEAHSSTGGPVFLDGLGVNLVQDATPLDLFAGPTLLDDLPFFSLPYPLADGESLPVTTLLFRLTGLVAGSAYTGSFSFLEFSADGAAEVLASRDFAFATPTPVPEPATLLLTGTGIGLAMLRHRRRPR